MFCIVMVVPEKKIWKSTYLHLAVSFCLSTPITAQVGLQDCGRKVGLVISSQNCYFSLKLAYMDKLRGQMFERQLILIVLS